jgi:hypothetical protein
MMPTANRTTGDIGDMSPLCNLVSPGKSVQATGDIGDTPLRGVAISCLQDAPKLEDLSPGCRTFGKTLADVEESTVAGPSYDLRHAGSAERDLYPTQVKIESACPTQAKMESKL